MVGGVLEPFLGRSPSRAQITAALVSARKLDRPKAFGAELSQALDRATPYDLELARNLTKAVDAACSSETATGDDSQPALALARGLVHSIALALRIENAETLGLTRARAMALVDACFAIAQRNPGNNEAQTAALLAYAVNGIVQLTPDVSTGREPDNGAERRRAPTVESPAPLRHDGELTAGRAEHGSSDAKEHNDLDISNEVSTAPPDLPVSVADLVDLAERENLEAKDFAFLQSEVEALLRAAELLLHGGAWDQDPARQDRVERDSLYLRQELYDDLDNDRRTRAIEDIVVRLSRYVAAASQTDEQLTALVDQMADDLDGLDGSATDIMHVVHAVDAFAEVLYRSPDRIRGDAAEYLVTSRSPYRLVAEALGWLGSTVIKQLPNAELVRVYGAAGAAIGAAGGVTIAALVAIVTDVGFVSTVTTVGTSATGTGAAIGALLAIIGARFGPRPT